MNNSALILVNAPSTDDTNTQWRTVLEAIVDNRRLVSIKHASIAMTVLGYARPAEQASPKQLYRIEEAVALLIASKILDATDLPKKQKRAA